jgi:eukaryotic-like serine/threonine-protein kinase
MTTGPSDTTNPQKHNKLPFTPPPADIAIEFKPGDIIGGNYEIVSLIGQGGMGNIYRARHNMMLEEYALKTLRAENLTDVSWKRFQKEAQAIGRMNHPNIVAIYNFGLHEKKVPYYVMAQLQGKTLHDLVLERGPMPWTEALPIFVEVCSGMGYAHKKAVIHRDIKPPNIVLLDNPQAGSRVKIVDFGIVKITDEEGDNQQLTNIGEVCGSPFYMSPEQCEAATLDSRSDIYSLGCTLYEVLTGAPPFRGKNVVDTMLKHQSATPATLQAATGKAFPPLLEQLVARMLAKSPAQRYQSMEEVALDLQAIIEGRMPQSAPAPTRAPAPQMMAGQPEAAPQFSRQPQASAPPQQSMPPRNTIAPRSSQEGDDDPPPSRSQQIRRPAVSQQFQAAQSLRPSSQDEPEDDPQYQTSMPPYFFKLLIGTAALIIIALAGLGFWLVTQKPPAQSKSPDMGGSALDTGVALPGMGTKKSD